MNEMEWTVSPRSKAMSPRVRRQISSEVDLIGRFAEAYRRKFSTLIDRMDHGGDLAVDMASLRLCVEAVDMMLANQSELARVLRSMAGSEDVQRPVARQSSDHAMTKHQ
jgi:hypothetical protein